MENRVKIAARAYLKTYEGPWGIKASEEDALLSVIEALYPAFPTGAQGIRAIRADAKLDALATELFEGAPSDGWDADEIAAWLLPRLDPIMEAKGVSHA